MISISKSKVNKLKNKYKIKQNKQGLVARKSHNSGSEYVISISYYLLSFLQVMG